MSQRKETLTRRQEALITALLQHGAVSRAATAAHIPESTAWRWMQQKEFASAYRAARRTITERSTGLLQQASVEAVGRLIEMMRDKTLPASVQYAVTRSVIELGRQGEEIADIQERIAALEAMLSEAPAPKGLKAA